MIREDLGRTRCFSQMRQHYEASYLYALQRALFSVTYASREQQENLCKPRAIRASVQSSDFPF